MTTLTGFARTRQGSLMKYWLILFWRKVGEIPPRNRTIGGIMALCALTLAVQALFNLQREMATWFGATPGFVVGAWSQLMSGEATPGSIWWLGTLVTALFMHANAGHFANNMLFLWAFGSLAVQHLGRWQAVGLFLVCGVCGNVAQTLLNIASPIPTIGASGAISGLEGIFLGLAVLWHLPWPDVWPLAQPIHPLQLGAFAVLGTVLDLAGVMGPDRGIAFGAHLGGFASGLLIAILITRVYRSREAFAASRWKR